VTQGFVGNFAGMLTLTVELYESMSGNMLGSFVTESENVKGLLLTIREKAPGLFANISPTIDLTAPAVSANPITPIQPTAVKKSNTSFFVALSLDILGAAAIGFGIYKHTDSNKLYDDYKKNTAPPESVEQWTDSQLETFESEKSRQFEKIKNAETFRSIGYAVGGALLASGIAVHIWF
jgi:hypothetical protein